jgi:hypothetical protein
MSSNNIVCSVAEATLAARRAAPSALEALHHHHEDEAGEHQAPLVSLLPTMLKR